MAEVKIRDLDAAVVKQLDQLAREKKMSRESFLRQFLTSIAALEESNHLIGVPSAYGKFVSIRITNSRNINV
ncbi:hypothetical protein RDV36_002924 [Listeria monocytogenes]|nr:hypothetical protein [Listeria monocytogenes]HAA0240432.1 hypothetical protein [Listeria monocytogenes]HAA0251992.1 hypothetical protein [Listeria monocytogenes]HAA7334004.1 hypothetical protein [Listeria monocytogenes]HAA7420618.1 hypothetical protein [Listeria monocytogenes]